MRPAKAGLLIAVVVPPSKGSSAILLSSETAHLRGTLDPRLLISICQHELVVDRQRHTRAVRVARDAAYA